MADADEMHALAAANGYIGLTLDLLAQVRVWYTKVPMRVRSIAVQRPQSPELANIG
jgi:hypothetical protein